MITKHTKNLPPPSIIGWREWIALPELGVDRIKTKIDTGARTSSLHAYCIEKFRHRGQEKVRFIIHPLQNNLDITVKCSADLIDQRCITDSGGHREERYVIQTTMAIDENTWPIEITLTNRDIMTFRMLLGRTAIRGRYLVNPKRSFLLSNR
jgi:hypothetical protein